MPFIVIPLMLLSILSVLAIVVVPLYLFVFSTKRKPHRISKTCKCCGGNLSEKRADGYFDEQYILTWCPTCEREPPDDLYLDQIYRMVNNRNNKTKGGENA